MYKFSTIGLIVKKNDISVSETLNDVHTKLAATGLPVLMEHSTRGLIGGISTVNIEEICRSCDLAIVIGGDGTLLGAVRQLVDHDIPIIGVNRGRLGFLVDVSPDRELGALDAILAGEYTEEYRFLLSCEVIRDGSSVYQANAFNDTVIHSRTLDMLGFDTFIDGEFVHRQRADGFIVSTPSGSTAYALSSGGPIIHPSMEAIVLLPICPHTLSSRPIVISSHSTVEIKVHKEDACNAQVVNDGQDALDLKVGDRVRITRKPKPARLIHPPHYDYYEILRVKLKWG